eukprot:scaffold67092_cov61-Phaeocystis_antarctica.AAC.3
MGGRVQGAAIAPLAFFSQRSVAAQSISDPPGTLCYRPQSRTAHSAELTIHSPGTSVFRAYTLRVVSVGKRIMLIFAGAMLRARRRVTCGRATAIVPARDGGRVPFLPSMVAAPLSLASTESGRLGPHHRAAQAGLEQCCGRGSLLQRGVR